MKKIIIFLMSYAYCFSMDTMPALEPLSGLDYHPYWQDKQYQDAAKGCFSHLNDLQQKAAVKAFCEYKKKNWQELLDPRIQYYASEQVGVEVKLISKEEKLFEESNFFFIKWDQPEQFITQPLTANGHNNTALLRIFFKDFTFQVLGLYSKARHTIVRKIDSIYFYDGIENHPSIQKLYPTKSDQIKALLKEAIQVNDAILKCFDAP